MATSTNYSLLEYVWSEWRKKSGKPIRKGYVEFVQLNNKASKENGKIHITPFPYYFVIFVFCFKMGLLNPECCPIVYCIELIQIHFYFIYNVRHQRRFKYFVSRTFKLKRCHRFGSMVTRCNGGGHCLIYLLQ